MTAFFLLYKSFVNWDLSQMRIQLILRLMEPDPAVHLEE